MATGTDKLINYLQGEDIIKLLSALNPAAVDFPEPNVDSFVYDGNEHEITFKSYDSDRIEIISDGSKTAVGEYTAIARLKNFNDVWESGFRNDLEYTWKIHSTEADAMGFATATEGKIRDMVLMADNGDLDLIEDAGWAIGDHREFFFNPTADNASFISNPGIITNQDFVGLLHGIFYKEPIKLTIVDTDHYDLLGGGKSKIVMSSTNVALPLNTYVLSQSNYGTLYISQNNMLNAAYCPSDDGSFENTRKWYGFLASEKHGRKSFPKSWRNIIKKFIPVTPISGGVSYAGTYITPISQKEIIGENITAAQEVGTSQLRYYIDNKPVLKYIQSTNSIATYMLRSAKTDGNMIYKNNTATFTNTNDYGSYASDTSYTSFCPVFVF